MVHSLDDCLDDPSSFHVGFVRVVEFLDRLLCFHALLGAVLVDVLSKPPNGFERVIENCCTEHDDQD